MAAPGPVMVVGRIGECESMEVLLEPHGAAPQNGVG